MLGTSPVGQLYHEQRNWAGEPTQSAFDARARNHLYRTAIRWPWRSATISDCSFTQLREPSAPGSQLPPYPLLFAPALCRCLVADRRNSSTEEPLVVPARPDRERLTRSAPPRRTQSLPCSQRWDQQQKAPL